MCYEVRLAPMGWYCSNSKNRDFFFTVANLTLNGHQFWFDSDGIDSQSDAAVCDIIAHQLAKVLIVSRVFTEKIIKYSSRDTDAIGSIFEANKKAFEKIREIVYSWNLSSKEWEEWFEKDLAPWSYDILTRIHEQIGGNPVRSP